MTTKSKNNNASVQPRRTSGSKITKDAAPALACNDLSGIPSFRTNLSVRKLAEHYISDLKIKEPESTAIINFAKSITLRNFCSDSGKIKARAKIRY